VVDFQRNATAIAINDSSTVQMPDSNLMTDREWTLFWQRQDALRDQDAQDDPAHRSIDSENTALLLSDEEWGAEDDPMAVDEAAEVESGGEWADEKRTSASLLAAARSYAQRTAPRTNRCGSCEACRAPDCGTCKECLDKPKFGGSGIRKKACIARVCTNVALHPPPQSPQPPTAQQTAKQILQSSPATASSSSHCAKQLAAEMYQQPLFARRPPLTLLDLQQPSTHIAQLSPNGSCRGALNILSASAVLAHQTPPPG